MIQEMSGSIRCAISDRFFAHRTGGGSIFIRVRRYSTTRAGESTFVEDRSDRHTSDCQTKDYERTNKCGPDRGGFCPGGIGLKRKILSGNRLQARVRRCIASNDKTFGCQFSTDIQALILSQYHDRRSQRVRRHTVLCDHRCRSDTIGNGFACDGINRVGVTFLANHVKISIVSAGRHACVVQPHHSRNRSGTRNGLVDSNSPQFPRFRFPGRSNFAAHLDHKITE